MSGIIDGDSKSGIIGAPSPMDFAWWSAPVSKSGNYTTYVNYARQGTSIIQSADRATIAVAGYYYAESRQRSTAAITASQSIYINNSVAYNYSVSNLMMLLLKLKQSTMLSSINVTDVIRK